jgi:hypothetical protein
MENNYSAPSTSSKPFFSSSSASNWTSSVSESLFSSKNMLITILVVLLVFSLLGINILAIIGNFFTSLVYLLKPLVLQILSIFGYVTGTVIEKSGEIVQKGGDVLLDASIPNLNNIKGVNGSFANSQPMPDSTTNPIQNPITSAKTGWCLVGEYEGRRGCIAIGDQDKCLSGQVFPNQQMCLNPTMNMPMSPLKSIPG